MLGGMRLWAEAFTRTMESVFWRRIMAWQRYALLAESTFCVFILWQGSQADSKSMRVTSLSTCYENFKVDLLSKIVCYVISQWRKFTFSGGGSLQNFRQTPLFALEKAVFSPLLGQNFRKFVIFHKGVGGGAVAPLPHQDFRHCNIVCLLYHRTNRKTSLVSLWGTIF
jgi:hypothetical protein